MSETWNRFQYSILQKLRKVTLSKDMETFLLISLGAIFGANLRYWVGGWAANRFGTVFPYGTLIINLTGSFVLGLFMTLATERFLIDPRWRLIVALGFLGGYTTFSSYTYESMSLLLNGETWLGLLDLLGSSIFGGLAVAAGILLGRII
ncbi:MAG: fluoride efflux transporter CrcB [Chloroflexi bacterium]|nr:fluoride efflux transporter CrcB [Chloroflexota bacterium]